MEENKRKILKNEIDKNKGILRLAPTWVTQKYIKPGKRLKLHPKDYYPFGIERGAVTQRWLSSTVSITDGDKETKEGYSYIYIKDGEQIHKILLKEAIEELMGDIIIGKKQMEKYGKWMTLAKFFDNAGPLPFHLHPRDEVAKGMGKIGKHEAYYFPLQFNLIEYEWSYTYIGLLPNVRREMIADCLKKWNTENNDILKFSRAYKITPQTGWYVPAGVLHAPGSLVTYEVQRATDISIRFQNVVNECWIPWENAMKDLPPEKKNDIEYIIDLVDWDKNIITDFSRDYYIEPIPVRPVEEMIEEGYIEKWVVYGTEYFSAKELVVFPKREVIIKDNAPYGFILIQGRGLINGVKVETPSLIRYGELTADEGFVIEEAAKEGVKILNESECENLVLLKHFGPENPDAMHLIKNSLNI